MSFSYKIEQADQIIFVALEGDLLNKQQVSGLMEELEFLFTQGLKKIIIDMSATQYMNSTGLSVLINIFTQTRNKGGEVVLANLPEKINKLLIITKLNSIFNIEETVGDAKKILI